MSYKEHLKEIEDEIKILRALNKTQGAMILRRNKLIESIFIDALGAAKGTVLENVKRKIAAHLKKTGKGKLV